MIDLEKIQLMWKEDSEINIDDLHNESLKIASLHSKYYEIYNNISLLRKRAELQYKQKKLERYNYYNGKSDPEIYKEEPFPYKVRDKEGMNRYLEADKHLSDIFMKIEYYDIILKYLEEIIKMISNRTYQIKNSIEFLRFQSGM
jgi:sulfite reductase alpha subunit-like flavoprotein